MRELIAFTDGGSRGNPGDAASAAHYPHLSTPDEKNFWGQITDAKYIGVRTNNEAEYEALILALRRALQDDYTKLTVFSDSKLMVNQMKGNFRVESPLLLPLYEEAYTLACQLDFEINWIPREKNKEADAVCNQVLDQVQGMKN